MVAVSTPPPESGPAWEVAHLFPNQGHWGEGDYLLLNRQTNRLVKLSDGIVEVLLWRHDLASGPRLFR